MLNRVTAFHTIPFKTCASLYSLHPNLASSIFLFRYPAFIFQFRPPPPPLHCPIPTPSYLVLHTIQGGIQEASSGAPSRSRHLESNTHRSTMDEQPSIGSVDFGRQSIGHSLEGDTSRRDRFWSPECDLRWRLHVTEHRRGRQRWQRNVNKSSDVTVLMTFWKYDIDIDGEETNTSNGIFLEIFKFTSSPAIHSIQPILSSCDSANNYSNSSLYMKKKYSVPCHWFWFWRRHGGRAVGTTR